MLSVIVLDVIILSVTELNHVCPRHLSLYVILSFIMLDGVILNAFILNAKALGKVYTMVQKFLHTECNYAEWHYALSHYSECRYAECHGAGKKVFALVPILGSSVRTLCTARTRERAWRGWGVLKKDRQNVGKGITAAFLKPSAALCHKFFYESH
jgi:hypothetical protein